MILILNRRSSRDLLLGMWFGWLCRDQSPFPFWAIFGSKPSGSLYWQVWYIDLFRYADLASESSPESSYRYAKMFWYAKGVLGCELRALVRSTDPFQCAGPRPRFDRPNPVRYAESDPGHEFRLLV